jgi:transcriptional regulator with XRE-family HTH domain
MKTNTKPVHKTTKQNKLWKARKRTGLELKQVALLAGKTTDEISRYEHGFNKPNLKTALKLEIIYRMPVKLLFPDLFRELETEVTEIRKQYSFPDNDWFPPPVEQLKEGEVCFYGELLKNRIPNELELRTIDKHIVNLMNSSSDYRSKPRLNN